MTRGKTPKEKAHQKAPDNFRFSGHKNETRIAVAEAPCPDCGRMIQVFSKNGPGTWEKRVRGQMVQHLKIHGYRSRPLSLKADYACEVIRYPREK